MGALPFVIEKRMRAVTAGLLLLCFVALCTGVSNAKSAATKAANEVDCTDPQNELKTRTAQQVLDCGNDKCKKAQGNSIQEEQCLCENCAEQNAAAKKASCACGLQDANSAAACKIYDKLHAKCESSANMLNISIAALLLSVMVQQFQ